MKLHKCILPALLIAMLLLTGCRIDTTVTQTPFPGNTTSVIPGGTITPQSGGEIRIPMPLKPQTTHPLFLSETEMCNLYSMIFEPLVSVDCDMLPSACIANSWEYETETNSFLVRLRSGVRFHDNTQLTSADVVFTFNEILNNPASNYYGLVSQYVNSISAVDIYTVRFDAKVDSYAFYYALSVPILPEDIYEDLPAETDILPVGSGAFMVASGQIGADSSMELTRNTYWWKKQPYIERIHAIGYKDNASAIAAFIQGDLDCVPTAIYTTDIYDTYDGVSCYSYISNYYDFLAPNLKNTLFQDTAVRQAISYAIDRKSIIANIYVNHGISMEYPFSNDFAFHNSDIVRYDYSLSTACTLLEQAGWVLGEDGIRVRDGKRFAFTLLTVRNDDNPVRQDTASMIRRQLKSAGIEVTVAVMKPDELDVAIESSSFDMVLTGYYVSDSPDVSFALKTGGSGNIMRYSDAQCDALLAELDGITNRDQYAAAYARLQDYVARQLPQIGLIGFSQTLLHRDTLVPSGVNRDMRVYENIDKWYCK